MEEQLNKVRHDILRYANCWEDADLLLEGLNVSPGDRVLSIGSAGDNSLSLLVDDPALVVAVDINEVQLYLIDLKKVAIQELDYQTFLGFLGFHESAARASIFHELKYLLPAAAREYWDSNLELIENGIVHQGKFEKYFRLFRKSVLPLIHSKLTVNNLLADKSAKEQAEFFYKHWNNLRWRLLLRVFFSRFLMGKIGRDPEFLNEVKLNVSTYIANKSESHLSSRDCQTNHFLHYIMKGSFDGQLPHYAREENFEIIKARIGRLETFYGFAEESMMRHEKFNKFNLSNIFEYMDTETFKNVSEKIINDSSANSTFTYWNLMVPRHMSKVTDAVNMDIELSKSLTAKDKCFFYSGIIVDRKSE
jgi:S-adenosylmethionine-diacylglycerol 3-amino-3-carboxypropyl transferase